MSQVLNVKERSQSFLKFFLFFVITMIAVLFAVFFDFRMPFLENKKLKDEVYFQRQVSANQERFTTKMEATAALLDSIGNNPGQAVQLRLTFDTRLRELNELNTLNERENNMYARMNRAIIEKLIRVNELFKQKDQLTLKANSLQAELDRCNADLNRPLPQVQSLN